VLTGPPAASQQPSLYPLCHCGPSHCPLSCPAVCLFLTLAIRLLSLFPQQPRVHVFHCVSNSHQITVGMQQRAWCRNTSWTITVLLAAVCALVCGSRQPPNSRHDNAWCPAHRLAGLPIHNQVCGSGGPSESWQAPNWWACRLAALQVASRGAF